MPGISKADALKRACEVLKIPTNDIIAFGDAQNDLQMFKLAGYAVAMGNAVEEVKKIADYVTTTNNEDGIASALEKLNL